MLETNAWAGGYELDLVVRRGRRVLFVEVKSKDGERFGHPLEAVDARKWGRIHVAAEAWLARHPELAELELRFEVAALRAGRLQRFAATV